MRERRRGPAAISVSRRRQCAALCFMGAIGCGHKVFNGIFATYLYLRYVQYNSNNFIQTKKKRPLLGAAFAKKIFFNTFKLDSEFLSARFIPGRRRPAPEEEEEDPSH